MSSSFLLSKYDNNDNHQQFSILLRQDTTLPALPAPGFNTTTTTTNYTKDNNKNNIHNRHNRKLSLYDTSILPKTTISIRPYQIR